MLEPELRSILDLARRAGVTEIELSRADLRLKVRRQPQPPAPATPAGTKSAGTPATAPNVDGALVRAPMVGYFYSGARPGEAPCFNAGDTVPAGKRVGCVDTLGAVTDVLAPADGVLVEYLTADGQPVEYGAPIARLASRNEA